MSNHRKQKDNLEKSFLMYKSPMYYYAFNMLGDTHMAEDAVQDAFCRMIKYIDLINFEDEQSMKGYMFTVIKTCVIDCLRKNKDLGMVTDPLESNVLYIEDSLDEDFNIDKAISEMSFDGNVGELVSRLKEEDQHILYLRYAKEAKDEEIADILNLKTTDAVRKRLSRARARLRNMFDFYEGK
jgi:RNA polymerase sigma-70 factor (ECF subfamily)